MALPSKDSNHKRDEAHTESVNCDISGGDVDKGYENPTTTTTTMMMTMTTTNGFWQRKLLMYFELHQVHLIPPHIQGWDNQIMVHLLSLPN
jgi:hypothetical protein